MQLSESTCGPVRVIDILSVTLVLLSRFPTDLVTNRGQKWVHGPTVGLELYPDGEDLNARANKMNQESWRRPWSGTRRSSEWLKGVIDLLCVMPPTSTRNVSVISSDPAWVNLTCMLVYIRQDIVANGILTRMWYSTVDLTVMQNFGAPIKRRSEEFYHPPPRHKPRSPRLRRLSESLSSIQR